MDYLNNNSYNYHFDSAYSFKIKLGLITLQKYVIKCYETNISMKIFLGKFKWQVRDFLKYENRNNYEFEVKNLGIKAVVYFKCHYFVV